MPRVTIEKRIFVVRERYAPAMGRAGVEGEPGVGFLECAERKPYE